VGVLQSDYALAIEQLNNNSVIGSSVQRPDATGVSRATEGAVATSGQLLKSCSVHAGAAVCVRQRHRTIPVRGPGQVNFESSLLKTLELGQRLRAQFRAEAMNVTNTPMFYGPNTTFGNPNFGRITIQANSSRLIQLGARFFL
jgi:hypothetical protein